MPRIGVFGEFGVRNFGNEASLDAAADLLARHGVQRDELLVICHEPRSVVAEHRLAAVQLTDPRRRGQTPAARLLGKFRDARHLSRIVAGLRAVLVPGTGTAEGQWVEPGAIPYSLAALAVACRLHRVPLLAVSLGADPFGAAPTRLLLAIFLRGAGLLTVRDEYSARAVARLARRRAEVTADLVLAGEPSPAPTPPGPRARRAPVVLLGVFRHPAGAAPGEQERNRYLRELVALARGLDARGLRIRLVVGDLADERSAEELVAASPGIDLGRSAVNSFDEVVALCAQADCMVATRYHNLVAALLARIPVVSIGYGPKQSALLDRFGLSGFAFGLTGFRADEVLAATVRALDEREEIADGIDRGLTHARTLLAAQDRLIGRELDLPSR